MKKILFTGGGSAGHVIPNLALIEEILSNGIADVCYMGTGGIEKGLLREWKIPFYQIECPKLIRGKGLDILTKNLKIPTEFLHAQKQALQGIDLFQPDLVFSKGGYVSLPVVFAARKQKIPCLAHESDLSVGLANRLTAYKCERLFTSFPETARKIPHGQYSGAPLRRSILYASKAEARKKFNIPFHDKVLLIFGGGSGSEVLNQAVRNQLQRLCKQFVVLHVCGKGNLLRCNVENYRQFEFITDMGMAYACADVIVSRAGAGSIFEILALKKPALLIPLEGQTRGDQVENATYFSEKGLCRILRQKDLSLLTEAIEKVHADETLKQRLLDAPFACGNELILREIKKRLL